MLLLKTQAGSRLYGYASATSDDDYYEVHSEPFEVPNRVFPQPSRQTIVDGVDVLQVTLSEFMLRVQNGSHQALDAMFAANPVVDVLGGFRASYRAGFEVVPAYVRIMEKFTLQEGFRKQRHALRAAFNLADMLERGRYEPELSEERISFIMEHAPKPADEFRRILQDVSPVQLQL